MSDPLSSSTSDTQPPRERLIHVAVSELVPGPNAPKSPSSSPALTESIKTYGVLQPVLVRPGNEGYEVIAGFKRFESAKQAGLTEIPVRVFRAEDAALAGLYTASNLQGSQSRQKISPPLPAGDYKPTGQLSGLLEEELNRKPSEAPYAFILTIAAILLGLIWGGIVISRKFTSDDSSVPPASATATPSGGSVLFPDDPETPENPDRPNNTSPASVAAWKQHLQGVSGIEIRNHSNIPRIVFQEPVFSRLTTIDENQKTRLKSVVTAIHHADPNAVLVIIGHTDNDRVRPNSTYQSNEHLGKLRAEAVKEYLVSNGPIAESKLRTNSSGATQPPFSNDNPGDKARNRTVTIEVVSRAP